MRTLLAVLLAVTPSLAPSADWRPAATHSFLAFAADAAGQQFRNVKMPYGPGGRLDLPEVAERLFGTGSGRCEVVSWWQPEDTLKLLCGPVDGVFAGQTDFQMVVRNAMPPGFSPVACPKDAAILNQRFLVCLRRGDGVEIELVVDSEKVRTVSSGKEKYALRIVAPLPRIDRVARQRTLSPLLAGMTGMVANEFRGETPSRFATRYATLLQTCELKKHLSGRRVLSCLMQNGRFTTRADLTAAVHRALPRGFHTSTCGQAALAARDCARNGHGVEVAIDTVGWPFSVYAYDASSPDLRVASMRRFFASVLKVAAGHFRGYDRKSVQPYFGGCGDTKTDGPRTFLVCSVRHGTFEGSDDYAAVVRSALPAGYVKTKCALDVYAVMGEDYGGDACFGAAQRPELEIGIDDVGSWVMWVIVSGR